MGSGATDSQWSRVGVGLRWARQNGATLEKSLAKIFVPVLHLGLAADKFSMKNASVTVVGEEKKIQRRRYADRWAILDERGRIRLKAETLDLQDEFGWCRQSIVDWKSYLREVYIDRRQRNSEKQRESGDFFILPVDCRNEETLLSIIKDRIADGTTIMSDCWKAYNCLEDKGFVHQTVNHSKNFVDPETRAHTQNIERLWRDIRGDVSRFERSKKHFVGYLARFEFRKKFKSINMNFSWPLGGCRRCTRMFG
ncbi:hypothetical protein ACLKA7_000782 [Drosophila subpalustris]